MIPLRQQAVSGVVPPQQGEAKIREAYPSVARLPALAQLGRTLTRTIILAPLAWLLMSMAYFVKVAPIFSCRYTLTNRRLMIRRGLKGTIREEVSLERIDDVRLVTDSNTDFFRAANLEIISGGQVVMTLAGVPEPDSFRLAILNARNAWVPGRSKTLPFIPASATK